MQPKLLVTGAGSGGHVVTAISVIKQIQKRYPEIYKQLLFVGAPLLTEDKKGKISIEERLCKKENIPFIKIRAGKLRRKLRLRTFIDAFKILLGFWDAFWLILKLRPKVILSFGGYVSLPLVFWGKIFGATTIIHEQTVRMGLSNRIASKFSDYILLSFKDALDYVPKNKKANTLIIGYPLREELFKLKTFKSLKPVLKNSKLYSASYIKQLEFVAKSKKPLILVTGGGLGSHKINITIAQIIPELVKRSIVFIQTGDNEITKDYKRILLVKARLPKHLRKNLIVRKFIYNEMGFLLNRANLLIGRSGSGTVYEAAVFRLPSIFVPIPWVTQNEQYKNAFKLKQIGLAEIIEEKNLSAENLLSKIKQMLKNPPAYSEIALQETYKTNSAEKIAKFVAKQFLNRT